jgi:hypothetical protein
MGKKKEELLLCQLCSFFWAELTQQKAGKDGEKGKKSQVKAPSLVFPIPFWLAQAQPALKDLFQREGVRVRKESGSFSFPRSCSTQT